MSITKFFCIALLIGVVLSDLSKVYNGVGHLSWSLLGKTFKNGENTVHSSFSISKALAMCLAGAEGKTLEVMKSTMGLKNVTIDNILKAYKDDSEAIQRLQRSENSFTLHEANKLYLNISFETNKDFINKVKDVFRAEAKRVDFKSQSEEVRSEINKFVAKATKDLIPEILTEPLSQDTHLAIVNAIYFKSIWLYDMTLDKKNTQKFNDFSCPKLTPKAVTWLTVHAGLKYTKSKEIAAQLVEVPYKSDYKLDTYASMVFILPDESKKCDLAFWLKSLTWNKVESALEDLSNDDVILKLPETELESRFELSDVLRNLGMESAFSNSANFDKMIKPGSLDRVKIDKVIHQAKMKINKEGTEAAAATVISGVMPISVGIRAPPIPITVTLNRSFVSIIVLRREEAIVPLFTAVVNSPK